MNTETKNLRLWEKLYQICGETNTKRSGIKHLVNYYIESLGWTENESLMYTIDLFKNGTITQIKMLGKGGQEL